MILIEIIISSDYKSNQGKVSDLFTNDSSSVFRFSIQIFDFWKLNTDIYFFSGIIRLQWIPMHIHLNYFGINKDYLFSDNFTCKVDQIHKMTTIFTQNGPRLPFCEIRVHFMNLHELDLWCLFQPGIWQAIRAVNTKFKLGKKSNSSNSILQIRILQKSSADR